MRWPTSKWCSRILALTGRDEGLIEHVGDRPGHDRRYSLASERTEGLGWRAQVSFAEGLERTVAWYRENPEWWGRCAPASTASTTSASTAGSSPPRMAERLPTELEGVVLIEPEVHGDRRGFLVETWRAGAWRELGVDVDFVQHNHSRSVGGTLRGLHFQTEPGAGEAGPLHPRGDLRRRRGPAA